MSNTNTGGPAFSFPAYTYPNGEINHGEGGMTLRDYFAAKAMQEHCPSVPPEYAARRAYDYADAMLKAREA
jgi:hypothetical protein